MHSSYISYKLSTISKFAPCHRGQGHVGFALFDHLLNCRVTGLRLLALLLFQPFLFFVAHNQVRSAALGGGAIDGSFLAGGVLEGIRGLLP